MENRQKRPKLKLANPESRARDSYHGHKIVTEHKCTLIMILILEMDPPKLEDLSQIQDSEQPVTLLNREVAFYYSLLKNQNLVLFY